MFRVSIFECLFHVAIFYPCSVLFSFQGRRRVRARLGRLCLSVRQCFRRDRRHCRVRHQWPNLRTPPSCNGLRFGLRRAPPSPSPNTRPLCRPFPSHAEVNRWKNRRAAAAAPRSVPCVWRVVSIRCCTRVDTCACASNAPWKCAERVASVPFVVGS